MPSAVVSAGAGHTACLLSDTGSETPDEKRVSLYCWGQGEDGQLGVGDSEDTHRPKEVTDLSDMKVEGICCGAHRAVIQHARNIRITSARTSLFAACCLMIV